VNEVLVLFVGEITSQEVGVFILIFFAVVMYSWAPRIGEAVGALFED